MSLQIGDRLRVVAVHIAPIYETERGTRYTPTLPLIVSREQDAELCDRVAKLHQERAQGADRMLEVEW
jgi:hypothetical protein